MSLRAASLQLVLAWQQSRANDGTNPTTQQGQVDHDLAGVSPAEWDELYHRVFLLTPTNSTELIDLKELLNHVSCSPVALSRVLTLYVKHLGDADGAGDGRVLFGPAVSDPATLFFADPSDGIILVPERCFILSDGVAGSAALVADDMQVTDAARYLQLDWQDGDDCNIEVAILGSTAVTG